ncbi:MAG: hypothetical protein HQ521_03510 [Bacteroidetes bacterium]|nr:hypothetical protein [Bacteroidota bacterium]
MKTTILLIIIFNTLFGHDYLYKNDGTRISGEVVEFSENSIAIKDFRDKSIYYFEVSDISKLELHNGEVYIFNYIEHFTPEMTEGFSQTEIDYLCGRIVAQNYYQTSSTKLYGYISGFTGLLPGWILGNMLIDRRINVPHIKFEENPLSRQQFEMGYIDYVQDIRRKEFITGAGNGFVILSILYILYDSYLSTL